VLEARSGCPLRSRPAPALRAESVGSKSDQGSNPRIREERGARSDSDWGTDRLDEIWVYNMRACVASNSEQTKPAFTYADLEMEVKESQSVHQSAPPPPSSSSGLLA
jgi:hypothetical protein